MEGPMQNLGLYNLEIFADQIFSVVWLSLLFQILLEITAAKLRVSQVYVFPIIKSEFTKYIILSEGCFFK